MALRALIPFEVGLELLGELPQDVDVAVWDGASPRSTGDPVDLWVPPWTLADFPAAFADLPGLRVVQTLTAGYDHVLAHRPAGVVVCSAQGVHDGPAAEWVIAAILGALRRLPAHLRAQDAGAPRRLTSDSLIGKTVTLLGYGGIGKAVEARLLGFEPARIVRVASRAREGIHGPAELAELAAQTDVLVIAAALNEQTEGLVGAEVLARLPDGALIVNVSRGPLVDQDALLAELSGGRLLAALDVASPDPLPDEHPLLRAPGLIYTPHVAGGTRLALPSVFAFIGEQIGRLASDEPLANVVAGP